MGKRTSKSKKINYFNKNPDKDKKEIKPLIRQLEELMAECEGIRGHNDAGQERIITLPHYYQKPKKDYDCDRCPKCEADFIDYRRYGIV